ncbi:hypothetical protein Tco_0627166 [Tanacetum coccineum]|uniref:Uncharacterized protein n=1 Tax=Tanacetum coccineum TaxID=301880 RepID=A0ABQ4WLQ8_9ASTR
MWRGNGAVEIKWKAHGRLEKGFSNNLMEQMTSHVCIWMGQFIQKEGRRKLIGRRASDIIIAGLPPCVAITPVLFTKEPIDSLIMEDGHLDTIPKTESDELIKSSVKDLVQIPSESKDSFEESLLHRDTSINDSQKIDSLLDEFAGELTLPHSIPPGIDDVNLNPEGDILFLESLLYDNSSPCPPEEFNSKNPTESFSPSPIPVLGIESTKFLSTLSPVIDTLLPFSSENEDKVFNHSVLASKEKSPSSSSHRGLKASKLFHQKSPMLIHRDNTPNLGVRHLHFYPP